MTPGTVGTPQGAVISPLLANIYLHYVFDLWAEQWRQRHAHGDVIMVRYADDMVVGFRASGRCRAVSGGHAGPAGGFALTLHPEKTRLIEFGRHAAMNRTGRGDGKPETFNFLGFTHICGTLAPGGFLLNRKSRGDRAMREAAWRSRKTFGAGCTRRSMNRAVAAAGGEGLLRLSRRAD